MSSHQAVVSPSCHFCFPFNLHNCYPSCREAGKGDDPCVTNERPCNICSSFSEEQLLKIKNRSYVRKQKSDTSDKMDLLGDPEVEDTFLGSHEDLEHSAKQLYSSPPSLQPLHFESLSLKMPQTVQPTPSTALHNRIENKLEKKSGFSIKHPTTITNGGVQGFNHGSNAVSQR